MKPSAILVAFAVAGGALAQELVPLKTDLPRPLFVGTPVPVKLPNLEPPIQGRRPPVMVPEGLENLALGKEVTASDMEPLLGDLTLVTDGDKEGEEGYWVELGPGQQWVQIDLGEEADIYAVALWHYHSQARVYHDVIVQVSDDPEFKSGVTTIFNNDDDNSSGMDAGKDYAYIETYEGRVIDAKGVRGRYVRLYSKGNTSTEMNHYIEVEVFGKPAA